MRLDKYTVNWVNDKGRLRANPHAGLVRLLAHERNGGEGSRETGRDHLLNSLVCLGHDIHR